MRDQGASPLSARTVVFLSWRDITNPEAGGAERYLHAVAGGLRDRGYRVVIFAAHYGGARSREVLDGIEIVRSGGKFSVYLQGAFRLLLRRFGKVDAVVDVQNGLPFFSRAVTRKPVVVLVHHVHREQWPVVYPGLIGRVGWWIERYVAPRLYRASQYVAVSQATRHELERLGVDGSRIAVVHNGTDPAPPLPRAKAPRPTLCIVGRLVPHKQVEHAIEVAVSLRAEFPSLQLRVVGDGWWSEHLHRFATEREAGSTVVFEGHVSEEHKHTVYAESWLMLLPSLKEGWGLVVGEAGAYRTPTLAYRAAGGTQDSIVHGESGVLVDSLDDLRSATAELLRSDQQRRALGEGAWLRSQEYTWSASQASFATVIEGAISGRRTGQEDPLPT